MGAVGGGPRRVRARGRARRHGRRDGAVRPQVAPSDYALDAFGIDRRATSRVPPAPTGARPVAEPQRALAIPAGVPGPGAPVPPQPGPDDSRPVSCAVAAVRNRARRHAGVVPANLRDPRRLGLTTRDAELRRGQLGGSRLRQRPARGNPSRRLRLLLARYHAVPPSPWAKPARGRLLRSDRGCRRAGREAGPGHPVRHLPHGIERHLADGVARAGGLQAHLRSRPDSRIGCRSSDRDGVGHERVRDDRGRPGAGWRPRGRHRQRPSRTAVCAADPRSTTVVTL